MIQQPDTRPPMPPLDNAGSVEQLVQEALAPLVPVVAVIAALLPVVAVVPIRGLAVRRLPVRRWRAVGRWWGRWCVPRLRRGRSGSRRWSLPAVVVGLGLEQLFQLTPVQEDPAAFGALIHRDAAAFVHSHLAVTLRAGHLHLTYGTRRCQLVERLNLWIP